ncbi:MAG TPA: PKD domain-containing protein, partial [Chitinophagaceae bacterium]|nr:PKD domain-containing protein [Chitinophagaceae bacterium]
MKLLLHSTAFILLAWILFLISCKKEISCEDCNEAKQPPLAYAGPDQVITLPLDSVSLDGRGSSDPDGIIRRYLWTKIAGPASFAINNTESALTTTKNLLAGSYLFELMVTDNDGLSDRDSMLVIVDSVFTANHPPVANAGNDTTITLPANSILLDGSRSTDPENNITVYAWTIISGPTSSNIANTNTVQTALTNLIQGVYQVELKVTDAGGLFSQDTLQVTVNPASSTNLPPVANAGADASLNYDLQTCGINPSSFTLNGTASADPDGTIASYLWTGPGTISTVNTAITQVSNITVGVHEYILTITDNNGATDRDTVLVHVVSLRNRPLVPAQLIPIGTLSQARVNITISGAGNKILFAGGSGQGIPGICASARVDIYDINTNLWSMAELSQARYDMGSAVLGGKLYFAGGFLPKTFTNSTTCYISNNPAETRSSVIDIYDAAANTWSTAQLNAPRIPGGASAGNKVIFAGGDAWGSSNCPSPVTDIYDGASNTWAAGSLSEIKGLPQIATTGDKIFLAGGAALLDGDNWSGISKRIDIYDAVSGSWAVDLLSRERAAMGSISANNKIYWGGGVVISANPVIGYEPTNLVEIRDLASNTTSFNCLCEPKEEVTAVRKDNKIIFFGTGSISRFDIFDLATNSWS